VKDIRKPVANAAKHEQPVTEFGNFLWHAI